MKVLGKIVLSLMAWFVAMLVVAASIEVGFGEPKPGYVPVATLIIMIPILFLIWRKKQGAESFEPTDGVHQSEIDIYRLGMKRILSALLANLYMTIPRAIVIVGCIAILTIGLLFRYEYQQRSKHDFMYTVRIDRVFGEECVISSKKRLRNAQFIVSILVNEGMRVCP